MWVMILASYIYLVLLKWTCLISILTTIFPSPFCEEIVFIFLFSYGLLTWWKLNNTFGPHKKRSSIVSKKFGIFMTLLKILSILLLPGAKLKDLLSQESNLSDLLSSLLEYQTKLHWKQRKDSFVTKKKNWHFLI